MPGPSLPAPPAKNYNDLPDRYKNLPPLTPELRVQLMRDRKCLRCRELCHRQLDGQCPMRGVARMKLFCKKEDASVYAVTMKSVLRFDLAVDYVGIGLSFRETAPAMFESQNRSAKLAGLNDCIVGQYTRVLLAIALQQMAAILDDESVWAMSLAGDGSTHRGQSVLGLRLASAIAANCATSISSPYQCSTAIPPRTFSI